MKINSYTNFSGSVEMVVIYNSRSDPGLDNGIVVRCVISARIYSYPVSHYFGRLFDFLIRPGERLFCAALSY